MSRIDYFRDPNAPKANWVVPSVTAVVRDDGGRLLLIHKTDNDLWALPGGGHDIGERIERHGRSRGPGRDRHRRPGRQHRRALYRPATRTGVRRWRGPATVLASASAPTPSAVPFGQAARAKRSAGLTRADLDGLDIHPSMCCASSTGWTTAPSPTSADQADGQSALDSVAKVRTGIADRVVHFTARLIAHQDLVNAPIKIEGLTGGTGRHVRIDERIQDRRTPSARRQPTLRTARVVRLRRRHRSDGRPAIPADQEHPGIQVPSTVERVKAGVAQLRRVADVVQPRSRDEEVSIILRHGRDTSRARSATA